MNPNSGKFILEQLQRFGSDLESKHDITFWLYFPNHKGARNAACQIRNTGLEVKVIESTTNSKWFCLVSCPHIPDEEIMDGIFMMLNEATNQYNGFIDGWETRLKGENLCIPNDQNSRH